MFQILEYLETFSGYIDWIEELPNMASTTVWPPPAYDGSCRFDVWKLQLNMYIKDKGITEDKKMVSALLQHIGLPILEKIIDWIAPDDPTDKSFTQLIALLDSKFKIITNNFAKRYAFFTEKQRTGQSLQDYMSKMEQLYGQCNIKGMSSEEFGTLAVLRGMANDETRQYLLTNVPEDDMKTMEKVKQAAVKYEQGKAAAKDFKDVPVQNKPMAMNLVGRGFKCGYCGGGHTKGKEGCPAKDKKCNKCGKIGHFSKVCRGKQQASGAKEDRFRPRQHQNFIEEEDSDLEPHGVYTMLAVEAEPGIDTYPPKFVNILINGVTVKFQCDSGAAVTIVDERVWESLKKPKLFSTKLQLRSYNQKIPVLGFCKVRVKAKEEVQNLSLVVVKEGVSLLGRNWMKLMGDATEDGEASSNKKLPYPVQINVGEQHDKNSKAGALKLSKEFKPAVLVKKQGEEKKVNAIKKSKIKPKDKKGYCSGVPTYQDAEIHSTVSSSLNSSDVIADSYPEARADKAMRELKAIRKRRKVLQRAITNVRHTVGQSLQDHNRKSKAIANKLSNGVFVSKEDCKPLNNSWKLYLKSLENLSVHEVQFKDDWNQLEQEAYGARLKRNQAMKQRDAKFQNSS